MDRLGHLALGAGRVLALLAALMVALIPSVPAHAHMHEQGAALAQPAAHPHDHAALESADRSGDHDDAGSLAHRGDCCSVCHVSVIPAASAVPLPVSRPRDLVWAGDRIGPPDVLPERLPEPPRSFA